MNFIKHLALLILAFGISNCCVSPLLLNLSIKQRTYCSFKEVAGLSPSPENIRSWVKENDETSYRLMVARRVLLHGIERGGSINKEKYAEVYLEIYHNLLAGIYGRDLKMAMISDDGKFIGIEPDRSFSTAKIAGIYYDNIIDELKNCINERKNASPYDWLSKEMRNSN
jgi:hypothetical protein